MADQAYETPELCMPSPADSANGVAEQSWYRHSGQTGDFSSGRSNSPNNSEWRQSGLFGSKTSSLDPRRITPTLHASLVSEILNLRRELENKNSFIDDLENNLQANKSELDDVNTRLNRLVRESTTQKNKSVEAERHMFRVTEELVRERDHAISNGQDLRTRFNALSLQARRQEEDVVRWQADWEEKSRLWDLERQNLHNRVNLTENHLRSLVSGLQTTSGQSTDAQARPSSRDTTHPTTPARATNVASYQAHRRNESTTSNFSDRLAELSTPRSSRHIYSTEKSLADELHLDTYDPFDNDELAGDDEKIFIDDRVIEKTSKARKVLGLDSPRGKGGAYTLVQDHSQHAESLVSPVTETPVKERIHYPQNHPGELDRQVQTTQASGYFPIRPLAELPTQRASGLIPVADFESYALRAEAPAHETQVDTSHRNLQYRDAATQYESASEMPVFEMEGSQKTVSHQTLTVPSISIHPPSTAPNSPRQSMRLLGAADAQTQTDIRIIRSMVDSAMQTEEIRIDRRRFDAHLDDHATKNQSGTRPISMQSVMSNQTFQSVSVQEIVTDLATKAIRETAERTVMARSPRSKEPASALDLQDQSNFWGGQSVASSSMLISLHDEPGVQSGKSSLLWRELQKGHDRTGSGDSGLHILHENQQLQGDFYSPGKRDSSSKESSHGRAVSSVEQARETPNLRTAFRSRGSSLDSGNSGLRHVPPFPVPTRSSSRIQSHDADDEAGGGPWMSPANGSPKSRRRTGGAHSAGIRKVRSGSNLTRKAQTSPTRRRRPINRPAVYSTLYEDHPYEPSGGSSKSHAPEPESSPLRMNPTRALTPVDEDNDTQVIDAIASAMVGEWVWKYASKRTSFGVGESSKKSFEDTNRQKRWVWVSPHDRTLMWSSKQPTSGAALLGRSSRKIRIKTVLDVKDDTPAPKTSGNGMGCYNRSIIVLSPDRALKISATTMERHYLWLMALSFLANPGQGPPLIPRLSTSVKVPGLQFQLAEGEPRMDDSVIERSVSRANANLLSQSRSVSSPAVGEDWFPSQSPDQTYSFTASAEAALQSNETYRPDTAGSVNDVPAISRFPSARSRGFPNIARRSSSTPMDLSASLSVLRSLTTRKPGSIRSVSSRNTKANPLSPTMSSHSDHGSASNRTNPALPLASTVRMTAFVEQDDEQHRDIDVEEEHMAPTGLGISTTLPDLVRPWSRTHHPSPPKRLPPPAPRSVSAREIRRPAEFALPYPAGRAADLESLSMATDEKRRMGYVFDDEGRDPFRGF